MKLMKSMKAAVSILTAAMLLAGCGAPAAPGKDSPEAAGQETAAPGTAKPQASEAENTETEAVAPDGGAARRLEEEAADPAGVYAEGPYGRISVSLPEGWLYQPYSVDSEKSNSGSY